MGYVGGNILSLFIVLALLFLVTISAYADDMTQPRNLTLKDYICKLSKALAVLLLANFLLAGLITTFNDLCGNFPVDSFSEYLSHMIWPFSYLAVALCIIIIHIIIAHTKKQLKSKTIKIEAD